MRDLIFVVSMAAALAWSGAAFAVVDEEKEVPVTGTDVPNATLVISDQATGKTISRSKVTDGKTHISIHEPKLNRKSKVIVTLKNEKGETVKERRDVALGWIFDGGIAFNVSGEGRSSESGNQHVVHRAHRISEQPKSRTALPPAPVWPQAYRWQVGIGADFGAFTTRNRYDDFPVFDSSGVGGGGHFDARFYFLPNMFAAFNAGILATNIRANDPETDAFANYKWQAWEMGQIGVTWAPPGATTPIDIYGGIGFTQVRVQVGTNFESMSKTMDGAIFRVGGDIFLVPNFAIGMSYSYSQFSGTIGGDPVKTQINTFLLSATYYVPAF